MLANQDTLILSSILLEPSLQDVDPFQVLFFCLFLLINAEWSALTTEELDSITIQPSLSKKTFDETSIGDWNILVTIPFKILGSTTNVKGKTFSFFFLKKRTGNFYKCGDELKKPHWISFFPIIQRTDPQFHRPECFGHLQLQ